MLVKDEFLAEKPIEQPDHEEYIGWICGMDDIKSMPTQHFQAQPECHEQRNTVFRDVRRIFVRASGHAILIHVDAFNTHVRLSILFGSLRADDTHLKAMIA